MATLGPDVAVTEKVVLAEEATLATESLFVAAPAARVIPTVPSPVQLDNVIVRVASPLPLTATEQVAPPVVLSVTPPLAKATVEALVKVAV